MNVLSEIGLALDIFGAVFIAKGLMTKDLSQMLKEAGSYFGYNPHLRDSLIRQRTEVRIGVIFLTAGFVFQLLPYLKARQLETILFMAIMLGFLWFFLSWVAERISRIQIAKQNLVELNKEFLTPKNPESMAATLLAWGRLMQIQRHEGETDNDLLVRMRQTLQAEQRFFKMNREGQL